MNANGLSLAQSIRRILLVGISASPLLACPVLAQDAPTTANDAVKAAAEAARAAADAARAAAEAAKVAAEAAKAAVEAANRLSPQQRQAVNSLASGQNPAIAEALQEIEMRNQAVAGAPAVATTSAPSGSLPAKARERASVIARGADLASAARVITRAEMDASGQTLLSEFLRDLAVNTIGSARQTSGSLAQSQSAVNLRGIGANGSLVLINGERIAGSPTLNFGATSNLNVIPMAAVERIEVLSEGASAVYGDNAVGGVINIVMATEFDGFSVSGTVGRPTQEGGDERAISVTGGVQGERGQISFALDHAEQDIVLNGDRDYSDIGLSSFGFPGSFFASGPSGESFGTFPDPRCPQGDANGEPTGTGEFPDSVELAGRCRYNYAGVSANEASLERNSLLVNADFEVNDSVTAYGRAIFTKNQSEGRAAPTPQVGGSPFLPTMSAANPNNPTNPANITNFDGDDLTIFHNLVDQNGNTLTGPFDLSIFYRNVPGGFRDNVVDDQLFDVLGGITAESDRLGGISLDIVAQHSEQTSKSETSGLALREGLQSAIDDGSFDIFGVNGPTDPNVAATFSYTASRRNELTRDSLRAVVSLDGLAVGSASLPIQFGAQTAKESFDQNFDPLSNAGTVDGSSGGQDVGGSRNATSVFGSAALNLGTLASVGYQVRTDDYDLHGNVPSQRLTASIAPIPGVTLHASYSDGFIAPDFDQVYSGLVQSFSNAIDVTRCAAAVPGAVDASGNIDFSAIDFSDPASIPCFSTQFQVLSGGNTELDVESVESWTVGVMVDVGDELSLAASVYEINVEDQVDARPLQAILVNEFVNGGSDQVIRNPNGTISLIEGNNQNVGATRSRGITLDAIAGAYRSGLGPGARLSVAYIDQLESRSSDGLSFGPQEGALQPNLRANLDLLWRFTNAIKLSVNGNYIGEAERPDQSAQLDSWLTWDAQMEVVFPWDGALAVGARNLFDEDPPISNALNNPFYLNTLHNPYGVVPYIRYRQEL